MSNYFDIKKKLINKAKKLHIPLHGEFELTGFCNLKCKMCYVREKEKGLSTYEWKNIFKSAVNEGMIFALLTGGEILTRKDFGELYNYLFDLGVKIILFTNGTLINEKIINILKNRPPLYIAITLYGASNITYEQVTQVKTGFDLVNKGINLLLKNNINILLRTIPIKPIYDDLDNIINYVKSKRLSLYYSLYIGPRRNSLNFKPYQRLTAEELVAFENKIVKTFGFNVNHNFQKSKDGFTCSALKSAFFITWNGYMQPCAMYNYPHKKVNEYNFKEVWNELGIKLKEISTCRDCIDCEYKYTCIQCPARLYLEGDITKCSNYLKAIAIKRGELWESIK